MVSSTPTGPVKSFFKAFPMFSLPPERHLYCRLELRSTVLSSLCTTCDTLHNGKICISDKNVMYVHVVVPCILGMQRVAAPAPLSRGARRMKCHTRSSTHSPPLHRRLRCIRPVPQGTPHLSRTHCMQIADLTCLTTPPL
jgi:hypothetical protein